MPMPFATVLTGALLAAATTPADHVAADHVILAEQAAGNDLRAPMFLCQPNSFDTVRQVLATRSDQWAEPTRAFDNLYFVGNGFVGVWVLRTSAGLILFDATESEANARDHLVPGLQALGLDPATIRIVIVTHGHWDHFGGAAWLQQTYHARIGLSAADWDMIAALPGDAKERAGRVLPRRDLVITDGQRLTLGDTTVTLYLTPGHTPGTISAIIPAREGGQVHPLSLLGSTAFPATIAPTPTTGGLALYDASVRRFAQISAAAGAEGILNTHVFGDGTDTRLAAARARRPGQPNPFLTGAAFTARYYQVLDQCLLAAEARAG
jgi:metallo-beta-lactamase class B